MRGHNIPRSVLALVLVTALAIGVPLVPVADAAPVVIDHFSGGLASTTLNFTSQAHNDTLAIEIPAGATIDSARLVLEGMAVSPPVQGTWLDWSNGTMGTNIFANWNQGEKIYPPSVDPDSHTWSGISRTGTRMISMSDDQHWYSKTSGDHKAPYSYPIQLLRFKPKVAGMDSVTVMWEGYSKCEYNQTNKYHAEMWLYNHTDDEWVLVEEYGSGNQSDVWLNHTFDLPSPFVKADNSIDFVIVGNHDETAPPPLFGIDAGHLYTDYVAVEAFTLGEAQWPSDVSVSVGATRVATLTGELREAVTVGDDEDLAGALQLAVHSHPVGPYNVTVHLNVSVGGLTHGRVLARDLRVVYEPVVNLAPEYTGPGDVEIEEDSGWEAVLDLGAVFTDDHDQGGLSFEILESTGHDEVLSRLGWGPGGNRTLDLRPASDFYGEVAEPIVILAEDAFGYTTTASLNVTVRAVPDRPRIDHIPELEALEDVTFRYTVNATDPDLPDDVLTFSDDTDLFDIDPVTGEFALTPGDEHVGAHNVGITVTDSFDLSDSVILRITVVNRNDQPELTTVGPINAVQDEEMSFFIRAVDPDIPMGDVLTYWAISESLDLRVEATTGHVSFTPGNGQVPRFEIVVHVSDLAGESDEEVLVVLVENVNDQPTFVWMEDPVFDQGEEVSLRLLALDPDLGLDLDPPEEVTFSGAGSGALLPDDRGWVNLTPDQSLVGEHLMTYVVTDSGGLSDVLTLTWTIVDVNDAPVIATVVPGVLEATEDDVFTLELEAGDVEGDALEWSDDCELFDIDPATGAISFTPLQGDIGTYDVILRVADGRGGGDTVAFQLVVVGVNDDPVIDLLEPEPGSSFEEGRAVTFSAVASDEDGDALSYTWTRGEKVLGTGSSMVLEDLAPGMHTITLTVTDGAGGEATSEVTIEVMESEGVGLLPLGAVVALVVVAALVAAWFYLGRRGKPGG